VINIVGEPSGKDRFALVRQIDAPLCSANNRAALVSALLLANDHALADAIEYS
jgi:hypothetical protein